MIIVITIIITNIMIMIIIIIIINIMIIIIIIIIIIIKLLVGCHLVICRALTGEGRAANIGELGDHLLLLFIVCYH